MQHANFEREAGMHERGSIAPTPFSACRLRSYSKKNIWNSKIYLYHANSTKKTLTTYVSTRIDHTFVKCSSASPLFRPLSPVLRGRGMLPAECRTPMRRTGLETRDAGSHNLGFSTKARTPVGGRGGIRSCDWFSIYRCLGS